MAGKKFYWLKLKRDFFKRHDIRIIEEMPNGKDYILFYLKMLLESIDHGGHLRFNETIPYNEQMLSVITNTNIDIVRSAMKVFLELHMVDIQDDETIYMAEVQKLTGSETANAARVREHRLRLEESKEQQGGNDQKPEPKTNAERQRMYRAKKACEDQQHIPYIEPHMNNKRYGGNYYIVMQRDEFKCALCNAVTTLCVHHIDGYDENQPENNDASRLVVMCRPCHSYVHAGNPLPQEVLTRIGYGSNVTQPCNTVTKICNTEIEKEIEIELDTEIDKTKVKAPSGKAAPAPTEPPVFTLPLNDGSDHPVTQKDIDKYTQLYPAVEVMQELRNMFGWLDSNPTRKKTKKGIGRFINSWLAREQNRGGTRKPAQPQDTKRTYDPNPEMRWD